MAPRGRANKTRQSINHRKAKQLARSSHQDYHNARQESLNPTTRQPTNMTEHEISQQQSSRRTNYQNHCLREVSSKTPRIFQTITKTYLYNFDPLKPHFYIVKLGFAGV